MTTQLDLGKLLRMDEMASQASRTEAVRDSAAALVHAYQVLRSEMLTMLDPGELREEFERLFQDLEDPGEFSPVGNRKPREACSSRLSAWLLPQ